MVVVHHPQLVGCQPVGLVQDASADGPDADEGQRQRRDADGRDRRPLRVPPCGQALGGDTGGDQADDLSAGIAHRRDGAHRRTQGAGVDLGVGLPAQRRFDGADVLLADLVGVGVGEPGAVGGHDRDERDVGALADGFGDRLENLCGVPVFDGRRGRGRVGQRDGDGGDLLAGGVVAVAFDVEQGQRAAGQDHQHDDRSLQREGLPGQRAGEYGHCSPLNVMN